MGKVLCRCVLSSVVVLLWVTPAPAQSAPSERLPTPSPDHVHDGFYWRLNFGGGLLGVSTNRGNALSASFSDVEAGSSWLPSGGIDVLLGGTPGPRVSVGGALLLSVSRPVSSSSYAGAGRDGSVISSLWAPFIDIFPWPKQGFHVGGAMGLVTLSHPRVHALGYGFAAWAGYGAWVNPDWSLGGLIRITDGQTGVSLDESRSDAVTSPDASLQSVMAMLSMLYH